MPSCLSVLSCWRPLSGSFTKTTESWLAIIRKKSSFTLTWIRRNNGGARVICIFVFRAAEFLSFAGCKKSRGIAALDSLPDDNSPAQQAVRGCSCFFMIRLQTKEVLCVRALCFTRGQLKTIPLSSILFLPKYLFPYDLNLSPSFGKKTKNRRQPSPVGLFRVPFSAETLRRLPGMYRIKLFPKLSGFEPVQLLKQSNPEKSSPKTEKIFLSLRTQKTKPMASDNHRLCFFCLFSPSGRSTGRPAIY